MLNKLLPLVLLSTLGLGQTLAQKAAPAAPKAPSASSLAGRKARVYTTAANTTLLRSRGAEMTDEVLRNLSGLDSTLAMRYLHERFGWAGFSSRETARPSASNSTTP